MASEFPKCTLILVFIYDLCQVSASLWTCGRPYLVIASASMAPFMDCEPTISYISSLYYWSLPAVMWHPLTGVHPLKPSEQSTPYPPPFIASSVSNQFMLPYFVI